VVADQSAVGCTGVLIVGTRGDEGPGEVVVRIRGGSEAFLARSDASLSAGTPVLVVESLGNRTLQVVEWLDPLESTSAETMRRQ
jgi:hypothetical protein